MMSRHADPTAAVSGGLLEEKTPQILNQQNNAANHHDSGLPLKKKAASANNTIVLNAAGVKAISTSAAAAKVLNYQQQAQHIAASIAHQHQQQQQQAAAPFVPAPFGVSAIPLPRIEAGQQLLLPALDPTDPAAPLITVVFDLDETLVYNRRMDLDHALLRPYALHMLNALRQLPGLEIVLWTASTRDTAAPVVDQLSSRGAVFDHLIFRDERWFTDPTAHTKDLRLLGRDMSRVVIVDNQPNCCKLNPGNSVLVEDYLGATDESAKEDASLVNLYYMVDFMLQNMQSRGMGVQQTLEGLALEQDERGRLCRFVCYNLPAGWTPYHVRTVRPLSVPAHGTFVRASTTTPAPLESWTA